MEGVKYYESLFSSFLHSVGLPGNKGYVSGMIKKLEVFNLPPLSIYGDDTLSVLTSYYESVVIPHKIAVFEEGMKIQEAFGIPVELVENILIYHDISKFSVSEEAYAFVDFKNFNNNPEDVLLNFRRAWHHHKMNNLHHPEYHFDIGRDGTTKPMPMLKIHVAEMVADWMGAGRTYGTRLSVWLRENLPKFRFHQETVLILAEILYDHLGIETYKVDVSDEILEVV